jgi:hypothetical protein
MNSSVDSWGVNSVDPWVFAILDAAQIPDTDETICVLREAHLSR